MDSNTQKQTLLQNLPGVDHILEMTQGESFWEHIPKTVVVSSIRTVIEDLRRGILDGVLDVTENSLSDTRILQDARNRASKIMTPKLLRTINGTGVIVHTNLGRSLLADAAVGNLTAISNRYSNLEFDLSQGKRGSRYSCVEDILCEISGAEAGMVVNNNAGAVLLCLDTIAREKRVIVSRGELVEIGGSFRIPDVMAKSGAILTEVGTTNRTHLKDYENAVENNTGLFLKVHKSNYSVVGFSSEVSLKELVDLGAKYHIRVMEDLGSGTFVDFSKYGMVKEPTVQESVITGADVVTFSGDKLLGGPQAGIIVGKKEILDQIKQNPITRALRIDKLTLAALESTLRLYRDEEKAVKAIPTLCMLTLPVEKIEIKANQLLHMLEKIEDRRLDIELMSFSSKAGGGSLPLLNLPSKCLGIRIKGISPNRIEKHMRENSPPIIGRIEEERYIIDLRTILDDELSIIVDAFQSLLDKT
ncbi:MAG: L-seryl-tRNA(Sec) selenium transferase [Thermodesulfobacteriota bacterium]|nr:L-seryl-tRNA(Sec) selenium transferase [Thermodesulfobacteriota bacterium]